MPAKRVTKRVASTKPAVSTNDAKLLNAVRSFFALRKQTAQIEKQQKNLRDDVIEPALQSLPTDDAGHRWLVYDDEEFDGGFTGFQWQQRVSQSFDEEVAEQILKRKRLLDEATRKYVQINDMDKALAILEEHGLVGGAMDIVTEIDQDAVLRLHYEQKISEAELDRIVVKKYSYALVPTRR